MVRRLFRRSLLIDKLLALFDLLLDSADIFKLRSPCSLLLLLLLLEPELPVSQHLKLLTVLLQLRRSHVLRPRHWAESRLPFLSLTIGGEVHKAHLGCDVLIVLHDGGLAGDVSIHHEGIYVDV